MGGSERSTIVLRLGGPIERADVPGLCAQLGGLVSGGAGRVVVCDVEALVRPDAVTVDALAQLQLTARRFGCHLRLRRMSAELQELLGFMGLQEVLLRLEVGRQAEEREERLGVEEERELDDPVA
jgi:ABC-type transporter Mla MlaB component